MSSQNKANKSSRQQNSTPPESQSPSYSPRSSTSQMETDDEEISAFYTALEEVDPNGNDSEAGLAIRFFITDFSEDSLVKEYVRLFNKLKMKPSFPSDFELNELSQEAPSYHLPPKTIVDFVNNMSNCF